MGRLVAPPVRAGDADFSMPPPPHVLETPCRAALAQETGLEDLS